MAAAAPHNDADTKADESKTEADREVAWHGTVKLVSQDNEELDVDSRAAEAALLVRRFLVDREADDEDTVVRFPVEKVDSGTLTKLVKYMKRLKETKELQEKGTPLSADDVKAWDAAYLDMPIQELFQLMLAGNFMDMPELLEFTCTYLAGQIKGKNPDELRELFQVENDFDEKERAEIAAEPIWDFD